VDCRGCYFKFRYCGGFLESCLWSGGDLESFIDVFILLVSTGVVLVSALFLLLD